MTRDVAESAAKVEGTTGTTVEGMEDSTGTLVEGTESSMQSLADGGIDSAGLDGVVEDVLSSLTD